METLRAIHSRRSTRKFIQEQISEEFLDTILKAGSAAPVSMGDYSVLHLTVVQSPEVLKKISEAVKSEFKLSGDPIYQVPTLVIISSRSSNELLHIEYSDVACCAENMILAATDSGVSSVYLWGAAVAVKASTELVDILGIPQGYYPLASVGLGYGVNDSKEPRTGALRFAVNRV